MPTLLSHTHCLSTRATTPPKPSKEYACPTHRKNNAQFVTKAKIKRAESADRKVRTTNKLYCSLKVKCFKMPASF
jgi:hypothetical protein